MMARLYFNAGYTVKCTLAVLSLICVVNFTAGAQSRGFSASVFGGLTKINPNTKNSPFNKADLGYAVQLSGTFPLGKNWGGIVTLEHNVLSADNQKTAEYFLNNDPNASAVTVKSDRFTISEAGIGIYYDWGPSDNFFFRFAPVIGYSYLRTPKTTAFADTEPHTNYTLTAGSSSALFFALHIRPTLKVSKQCAIFWDTTLGNADYKLSAVLANQVINHNTNYTKVTFGLGLQYSFSSLAK